MLPATLIALLATSGGPATAGNSTTASTATRECASRTTAGSAATIPSGSATLAAAVVAVSACRHNLRQATARSAPATSRRRLLATNCSQEGGRRVLRLLVRRLPRRLRPVPERHLQLRRQRGGWESAPASNYNNYGGQPWRTPTMDHPIPMSPSTHTVHGRAGGRTHRRARHRCGAAAAVAATERATAAARRAPGRDGVTATSAALRHARRKPRLLANQRCCR